MKCSKPKGSSCQVFTGKDGTQKPRCVCPKTCPSNYGRQYDNECLLHKEACRKHRQITVSYHGECLAKQAPCSKEDFAEFPFRLLNWFLHLREIDEFGVVNDTTTQALMTKKQRKELAKWQFEVLDVNKDGTLSQRDLMEFRYRLMPLEHCAGEFFRSCDANGKQNVRLEEWIYCLVKRSEKWYEEFMEVLEYAKRRGHFSKCPKEYKHYCIKGKCRYVVDEQQPACICEKGYIGSRCELLDFFYQRGDQKQIIIASLIAAMVLLIILIIFICICAQ
ncbi:Probetacellulin [Acipenser ruthenus]|uniref:Probetacellulin n=1 Tax=Acipenser ruthenus TaxID=7906 RepID=A0A662YV56_ACIRT|nr:Probetacellulin [Acipenser ruthenus]